MDGISEGRILARRRREGAGRDASLRRPGLLNEEGFGQRDGQSQKAGKCESAIRMDPEGKSQFQMQRCMVVGAVLHV